MEYNTYIENQLLDIYMSEMDDIVEAAGAELFEFNALLEAEGTELSTEVKPDDEAKSKNKKAKLKEIFEKLKIYIDKFIEAFNRIIDIVKTKITKLAPLVAGKFKVAGKAEDDITILKFDVAKTNAANIDKIIKDVDDQIIKPIDGNQPPKTDTLDDFRTKFEEIDYSKVTKDEKNLMQFKKGAVIRNNVFAGLSTTATDISKTIEQEAPRNREFKKILNNIIPQVERSEDDATENLQLLNRALYFAIQLHRDVARYNTKLLGDLEYMSKHCAAVSG